MLSRIDLRNFKVFREGSIPIAPLTLLAGLNGSGKSTLIQALAMLRQSHDTGFLAGGSWLLNGELVELGSGSDVLHDNPSKDGSMGISLTAVASDTGQLSTIAWSVGYDPKGDVLTSSGDAVPLIASTEALNLFGSGFQYLRADRLTPAVTYAKSQHAVATRRFLGSRGEYAAHFLLEYADNPVLDGMAAKSEQANRLLSQTNAWMQRFSPNVSLDIESIKGTDLVRLRYSYRTKGIGGGGGQFRATNVGFGLSYSLPILVACLSAHAGDLLLIENPEAHLHPDGQLAMGELIARAVGAGVQVVVETHSDHVLNGIRLAIKRKIVDAPSVGFRFFVRDDSGASQITCPTCDANGMLSEWPEGFFTQWDQALLELLS
jgi:predicted ATPase